MLQSFQGIQVNLMYFLHYDGTVVWSGIHILKPAIRWNFPNSRPYRLPPDRLALLIRRTARRTANLSAPAS